MMGSYRFYKAVQEEFFHGKLSTQQYDGMQAIMDRWHLSGFTDLRWLAYMLGTTYHETASTMYPIEEFGKGKGRMYGKKIKQSGQPYTFPDHIYYGRGYVQITWYENYERMGRILGVSLLEHPELALRPDIAADIMIEGMTKKVSFKGDFTGKSLEMYFNETKEDWINARRIINGTDKDELIAGYAKRFYRILINS